MCLEESDDVFPILLFVKQVLSLSFRYEDFAKLFKDGSSLSWAKWNVFPQFSQVFKLGQIWKTIGFWFEDLKISKKVKVYIG